MRLDIEQIEYLLGTKAQSLGITHKTVTEIMKELHELAEEEKAEREKEKEKEQKKGVPYPILIATSYVPGLENIPFFIVEAPDDAVSHDQVVPLFSRAVGLYNRDLLNKRGKKRKKHKREPLEKLGEAMEFLPRTWLKQVNLKARFKVPCTVVVTDNLLDLPDILDVPDPDATPAPFDRAAVEAEVLKVQTEMSADGNTLHIGGPASSPAAWAEYTADAEPETDPRDE